LVDNTGKQLGPSLLISKSGEDSVADLAASIKEMNKKSPEHVPATRLIIWKPSFFDFSPRSTFFERVKGLLDTPEDQRDEVELDMGCRLRDVFPPDQPLLPDHIHVIAQLPRDELIPRNDISFRSNIILVFTSILPQAHEMQP
jgi:hypothetical protein